MKKGTKKYKCQGDCEFTVYTTNYGIYQLIHIPECKNNPNKNKVSDK